MNASIDHFVSDRSWRRRNIRL